MALKGQALTVQYVAWNTSTNVGQTADAANHTIRAIGDGTEYTPAATPTEVDATNLAGVYKIALAAGEMNYNCVTIGGKSSTANVVLIPITITTERGVLPTVAPGTNGGLPTLDASLRVAADAKAINGVATTSVSAVNASLGTTQPINFTGTGAAALVKSDTIDWNSVGVGAMPNSATPPTPAAIATSVWTDLLASSDFSTASSIGALLKNDIDAAISSRLAASAYTAPPSAASIAAAVLTDTTDTATAGSLGYLIGHAPSWYTASPTTAQIATAVWTDTTAGDFATASTPGKILVTQLGGTFTNTTGSVFAAATLANAPGGSASDPWATALPGSYATGTAGYIIGHQLEGTFTSSTSSIFTSASLANAPGGPGSGTTAVTDLAGGSSRSPSIMTVQNNAAQPIQGATVTAYSASAYASNPATAAILGVATTDTGGHWTLNITAGTGAITLVVAYPGDVTQVVASAFLV